jgi:hypothetical protein
LCIIADEKVPTEWAEGKNVKWKLTLPGRGFSSPIVVGENVFVTSYTGSDNTLKRQLVCVDRKTGKATWTKEVAAVQPEFRSRGGFGYHGYASSTPVSDGERVYVLFGTTGVMAFDLKGEKVWQQSVGTGTAAMFGSSTSPILYKDFVIVTAASESTSVRAFDRKTGKEIWKAPAGSLSGCYSTPTIAKNKEGEDELLVSVVYEMWALNPANGKLKWYAPTQVDTGACTSIVADEGIAYVVGGRSGGRTAVKMGGKDDAGKNVVWTKRGGCYVPSPILHKGHLYWVDDRGAHCVNAANGDEVGSARISGQFYSSVVLIGDKLFAVSRFGGTYVLEANPKLKQVAHNTLSDTSDFSGTPAVSDGQLFIRSDKALYCIEKQ